jgi:hypothetical protein
MIKRSYNQEGVWVEGGGRRSKGKRYGRLGQQNELFFFANYVLAARKKFEFFFLIHFINYIL